MDTVLKRSYKKTFNFNQVTNQFENDDDCR